MYLVVDVGFAWERQALLLVSGRWQSNPPPCPPPQIPVRSLLA